MSQSLAATPIHWPDAQRQQAFQTWLAQVAPEHGLWVDSVTSASADASFRRYFRIRTQGDRTDDAEVPGAAAEHLPEVPAVDPAEGVDRAGRNSGPRCENLQTKRGLA